MMHRLRNPAAKGGGTTSGTFTRATWSSRRCASPACAPGNPVRLRATGLPKNPGMAMCAGAPNNVHVVLSWSCSGVGAVNQIWGSLSALRRMQGRRAGSGPPQPKQPRQVFQRVPPGHRGGWSRCAHGASQLARWPPPSTCQDLSCEQGKDRQARPRHNLPLIGWHFGAAGLTMKKLRLGYLALGPDLWASAQRRYTNAHQGILSGAGSPESAESGP
jgi:hypothetical protein